MRIMAKNLEKNRSKPDKKRLQMINNLIRHFVKGIKNPLKVVYYGFDQLKLTERSRVSGGGERLVVKKWEDAAMSKDFITLSHLYRYKWILPYVKNLYCLDAGCGTGYGTHYLADNGARQVIGIDNSIEAISFAKRYYQRENLEYNIMDVCDLRFSSATFDAIISSEVLEHLNLINQEKFVSETARVLKPSGFLYIGCPNAALSKGNNPFHPKELTRTELEQLLLKYYANVKILGHDILIRGKRQKDNFLKHDSKISLSTFTIVEENCNLAFGLIAICKSPKIS